MLLSYIFHTRYILVRLAAVFRSNIYVVWVLLMRVAALLVGSKLLAEFR